MKKILIFGGTGAMGTSLVDQLSATGTDELYVTSRNLHKNKNKVMYIHGDALQDDGFIKRIFAENKYDVLIDFMVYSSKKLKQRLNLYLTNVSQYIFFSSSRVYASSNIPLTETSPRLLDVCKDSNYLSTDEYALAKAKEENLLINNDKQNWTIIRPYITYNTNRLQLGVYEKENWLYRAFQGRKVVLPRDIAKRYTNLTYAPDVTKNLISLIGNQQALGQIYHIVNNEKIKWENIAKIYKNVFEQVTGKKLGVEYINSSDELEKVWNPWQIKYDRLYDRIFNSKKVINLTGENTYMSVEEGLTSCLTKFLAHPKWIDYQMNWKYEGWSDRIVKEWTKLSEISDNKSKLRYLKYRLF